MKKIILVLVCLGFVGCATISFAQDADVKLITKDDAIRIAKEFWSKQGLKILRISAREDKGGWMIYAETFIEEQPNIKGEIMVGEVILALRLDENGNWINDGRQLKKSFTNREWMVWQDVE